MGSDSENEDVQSFKGVSGTIILINNYDPSNIHTAVVAHEAVGNVMRNYMKGTNSQLLNVCLYGVKDTYPPELAIEGLHEIFPLTSPTLEDYKNLKKLDINSICQSKELTLSNALWYCSRTFANCKKMLSTKTVIILTRLDIPPEQADQGPTFDRIADMVISGIHIKFINISQDNYSVDKFYENFLVEVYRSKDVKLPEPLWDVNEISNHIWQNSHRNIAIAKLFFEIGDGLSLGVGIYSLQHSQAKLKTFNVDKETNQIVTSVTTNYKWRQDNESNNEDDSMENVPLLKSEILHFITFGDERIEFTSDEMTKIKNPFGPPILKLLGFKPGNLLSKEKWFLKTCQFLFPNESSVEGSTVAFKALHQACLEMNMIAICVLCTRVNSRPFIVALVPCKNPLGLNISVGFDIIYIPFVENKREVPTNEELDKNIDEAHKIFMKDIIKDLKFDYKPDMFENPGQKSLHSVIEALALKQDHVESTIDTTKQNVEKFSSVDADLFEEMFGPFGSSTIKRPRPPSRSNEAGAKRSKVEGIDESLLDSRLQTKQIEKYTVTDLKKILKAKNVSKPLTGLKKDELVKLVYETVPQ